MFMRRNLCLKGVVHASVIAFYILFLSYFVQKAYKYIYGDKFFKPMKFFYGNETHFTVFPGLEEKIADPTVEYGNHLPNCGGHEICPDDHTPVHIYSGSSNGDYPKICINGRYVIQKGINQAHKGINVVVFNQWKRKVVVARGFDLRWGGIDKLMSLLHNGIQDGEIVIVIYFHRTLKTLSQEAMRILAELGSSHIQNIQHFSHWYMITQKGINGFTPFEELHYLKNGKWSVTDRKMCIPPKFEGFPFLHDSPLNQDLKRGNFCQSHLEMQEFCSVDQRLSQLQHGILVNRALVGNSILTSPKVVLAGGSLSTLALTLETLVAQQGIKPKSVLVFYNPKIIDDVPQLCELFGFHYEEFHTLIYHEILSIAFNKSKELYPSSKFVTLLEAGVLLSPDFMLYTGKALSLLQDSSVFAISAWNPNGYSSTSSRIDIIYRGSSIPGLGFTMKYETYNSLLKPHMKFCCNKPGWHGWTIPEAQELEVVYPDVSRAFYKPSKEMLGRPSHLLRALFLRSRETSFNTDKEIRNVKVLLSTHYDSYLDQLLSSNISRRIPFTHDEIVRCSRGQLAIRDSMKGYSKSKVLVIGYRERSPLLWEGMKILARCFGLFNEADSLPRGIHKGLLRFSMNGLLVVIVSDKSPLSSKAVVKGASLVLP